MDGCISEPRYSSYSFEAWSMFCWALISTELSKPNYPESWRRMYFFCSAIYQKFIHNSRKIKIPTATPIVICTTSPTYLYQSVFVTEIHTVSFIYKNSLIYALIQNVKLQKKYGLYPVKCCLLMNINLRGWSFNPVSMSSITPTSSSWFPKSLFTS